MRTVSVSDEMVKAASACTFTEAVRAAHRFDSVSLPRWMRGKEFKQFVRAIVRNLPLKEPSVLTVKGLRRILVARDGVSARIFRMLNNVAIDAIETGVERITDEAMEKSEFVGHLQRKEGNVVERLQRALPLAAHGKPELLAFLRSRKIIVSESPRLKIASIFQVGRRGDLVCRIVIDDGVGDQMFFAPLTTLTFDHRHLAGVI